MRGCPRLRAPTTVRRNEADPRQEIPAAGWAYVNPREIRLLPEGTLPEPGSLYELHYPATNTQHEDHLFPDIAVPFGTHTGWNLYRKPYPEAELCDRFGTYIPFAATRAEREAKGDPRPSLAERYGDHAGYVRQVEAAVKKLVAERRLLAEDADAFVAKAKSEETAKRFAR